MKQYIDLCKRVLQKGEWVKNTRTGKRCLTVINADLVYDVSDNRLPVLTTKKVAWRMAIGEMLGYIRGYSSAKDFRDLGVPTWDNNANENEAWLANPARKGPDDMGRVYGVQGRQWLSPDGTHIDQLANIVKDLSQGIDNRRELLAFWNPGEMDEMCLPPCMHTHMFSILDETLYLTSYQRSADLPLGVPFNMIQCAWFLLIMARITGLRAGKAFHKMVNVHIYEDQLETMEKIQIGRTVGSPPIMHLPDSLRTFEDLQESVLPTDFKLIGYNPQPTIKYPFSV